jgi:hypothetical protein
MILTSRSEDVDISMPGSTAEPVDITASRSTIDMVDAVEVVDIRGYVANDDIDMKDTA